MGTAVQRLERLDLRPCARTRRAAAIERQGRMLAKPTLRSYIGAGAPRASFATRNDDHALVIKLHHLVTDGWSQRLFWKELEALYGACVEWDPAKLPELPVQYRHFVDWQRAWLRTRASEEQLNYWLAQLKGLTELPLRTDQPRPERCDRPRRPATLQLSRALSRGIKSLSRDYRATLFMTLLAAFQAFCTATRSMTTSRSDQ